VVGQPAFDEKRVRKLVEEELGKLVKHIQKQ
jgi:hypothetical protein